MTVVAPHEYRMLWLIREYGLPGSTAETIGASGAQITALRRRGLIRRVGSAKPAVWALTRPALDWMERGPRA